MKTKINKFNFSKKFKVIQDDLSVDEFEAHGIFTAFACNYQENDNINLICDIFAIQSLKTIEIKTYQDIIFNLRNDLDDLEYKFEPYILKSTQLTLRFKSLVSWINGFLAGFAACHSSNFTNLNDEIKEFILDLTKIAKTECENNKNEEESFEEIFQYIKLGVLYIRREINNLF